MKPEDYSLTDLIKEYDGLDTSSRRDYINSVCISLFAAYDFSNDSEIRDTINDVFNDTEIYCEGYLGYITIGYD
ncbi:hypothetical protein KY313_03180 [Candidatus Woesearchaeota archaeon]|jgi:hypothetical protein|nr:hypothetical protein [Candidatus Woesearchaeota archaeon]